MSIEYACFVSYAHSKARKTKAFIEQLAEAVSECLDGRLDLDVYVDKERLTVGVPYNEKLAEAMCQSVCMIVVLSPIYAQREYCQREFAGINEINKFRKKKLEEKGVSSNFFIPLVYAGRDEEIPPEIKENVQYRDVRKFKLGGRRMIYDKNFEPLCSEIADQICERYDELRELIATGEKQMDCKNFSLPKFDSPEKWPLKKQSLNPPFPGR